MNKLNILIVDDEELIREELREFLDPERYQVSVATRPAQALETAAQQPVDIVLLDINMPGMTGIEVLGRIKELKPEAEVIMMTGYGDSDNILQALRLGAFDFFHKPLRLFDIQNAIERTGKFIELNHRLRLTETGYRLIAGELKEHIGDLIGSSAAMKTVMDTVFRVAPADDTSVLITGESGTGKEIIARCIHYLSNRKERYFYALNCSAVPETLVESELFGHRKGSFTGAIEDKIGCFEAARGGTLFLDEIGDMPAAMQTKLLRALEDRKIKRIGTNREVSIDVRVIAATNQPLADMVRRGQFRLDLYHRLNTVEIRVPTLRERVDDIPLLVNHYVNFFNRKLNRKITGVSPEVITALSSYDFPGNVRELKNMVERAVILAASPELRLADFPLTRTTDPAAVTPEVTGSLDLIATEKRFIRDALQRTSGNKAAAAKLLNISYYQLNRKMKKYRIEE